MSGFGHIEDGSDRNTRVVDHLEPIVGRVRHQHFFEFFAKFSLINFTVLIGTEAVISDHLGLTEYSTQEFEEVVVAATNGDVTVRGFKDVKGGNKRVPITHTVRGTSGTEVLNQSLFEERHRRVEHGNVNVRALTGALASVERR